MRFLSYDLGHRRKGETAVVTVAGDSVNVRLMDTPNFASFKRGARHRYVGGHITRSPYRVSIPGDGHWHVVIDRGGHPVSSRASVRVEGRPIDRLLPPAGQSPSTDVATIRDVAARARNLDDGLVDADVGHDVFISHASEDKDEVVRPLADALQVLGLGVWYDEYTLRVGDSLRRKIDSGLATSRFGVVVLSQAFFAKNWPQYELDGLVTREQSRGEQIILPIWHKLTKDELVARSPSLADKVALRTGDLTIAEIAQQIADAVSAPTE